MKVICPKHQIAYEEGVGCSWCDPVPVVAQAAETNPVAGEADSLPGAAEAKALCKALGLTGTERKLFMSETEKLARALFRRKPGASP